MMNTFRKIAFVLFAVFMITASSNSLLAQEKYGHLNYGNLIELFPEREAADNELKTYREQLIKQGQAQAEKWQKKVEQFQKDAASGTKAPLELQKTQTELEKEQKELAALENEVVQKVSAKRDALLKPIVDKLNKAIDEVGKENGYKMIFDTSLFNVVLFAEESDDVLPLVKKKLGM